MSSRNDMTLGMKPTDPWEGMARSIPSDDTKVREDLRVAGVILRGERFAGWTPLSQRGNWHDPLHFHRDHTRVWRCSFGWQVADIIDGRICNHRGAEGRSLEESLKAEGVQA